MSWNRKIGWALIGIGGMFLVYSILCLAFNFPLQDYGGPGSSALLIGAVGWLLGDF